MVTICLAICLVIAIVVIVQVVIVTLFMYANSGTDPKGGICQVICPYNPSSSSSEGKVLPLTYSGDFEMEQFVEEVRREYSLYTDMPDIDFFRSKLDIFATGNEEDVMVLSCDVDERVCDQESASALDESFLMYMAVLEEFEVTIPSTTFEKDVLKFLNVAPSQIRPNSWVFIRGFEILCKALSLEPSVGVLLHFYGTKDLNKGTWISISAHPGDRA